VRRPPELERDPLSSLPDLKPGQSGQIVSLTASPPECAREFAALGIAPGAILTVLAVFPQHMIFRIARRKIAADRKALSAISVRAFDLP
jgi:Fe2+ transport system protein FeoA